MERWKTTCGFLRAEASSAVSEGEVGWTASISGLFFVYTVICQGCANITEQRG